MSIATRRRIRRSPEASRDNILSAAQGLLLERGPQALKLVDIAAAARVSQATVMHHFGTIGGVHAALMERMIQQLVARVLAISAPGDDPTAQVEAGLRALFDAFEERGAARIAAWLELTGEARRMTLVRKAVQQVVAKRAGAESIDAATAADFVLVSIILALGVGLFGPSLAELVGAPKDAPRRLAFELLNRQIAALSDAAPPPKAGKRPKARG